MYVCVSGVPKETGSILKLREAVDACRIPSSGPLVVHCRYVLMYIHVQQLSEFYLGIFEGGGDEFQVQLNVEINKIQSTYSMYTASQCRSRSFH